MRRGGAAAGCGAGNKFFYNPVHHTLAFTLPPNLAVCAECEERWAEARMPEGAFCHQCMDAWDVPKHYVSIDGSKEALANVAPLNLDVRWRVHAVLHVACRFLCRAHMRTKCSCTPSPPAPPQEFGAHNVLPPPPLCVECEEATATQWCDQCEDAFCDACALDFHQRGKAACVHWE